MDGSKGQSPFLTSELVCSIPPSSLAAIALRHHKRGSQRRYRPMGTGTSVRVNAEHLWVYLHDAGTSTSMKILINAE